ncbi:MAG: 7-carboxy-7-deazaguanine synthase QueE [Pseudomonadota bacterium]
MTHEANIVEVFSSRQGEGPHAGERMTFVRFGSCSMRCCFCDTPQGLSHDDACRVEIPAGSGQFSEIPNPVGAAALSEIAARFGDDTMSITGGEPLEQADFLAEWLPSQAPRRRILLETNGILHKELLKVLPFVHIVSMDLKLPSSCGMRAVWEEHALFLRNAQCAGKEIYVKLVITAETTDRDIQSAIDLMSSANKHIPLVLQPASATLKFRHTISEERLQSIERLCSAYLPNVRVVPQMHKEWGVL